MFSEEGVIFRDRVRWPVILVCGLTTLVVFHVAFLGWRLTDGQIKFTKGHFQLTSETSAQESLRETLPGAREVTWLPGQEFSVHVYPYLSPLTKLFVSLYSDFTRARTLANEIESSPNVFCRDVPTYAGVVVPNCFLTQYRAMALKRAFVSPAFGVMFETQYRQAAMKDQMKDQLNDQKPLSPMLSFGLNAVSVDNLVTLLEPGELVFDRRRFVHPIGLLAIYGSPEIPAIALGQDLQHYALSKKLLPLLAPQLAQLNKGLNGMKGALTPIEEAAARETLSSLSRRINALELDPLALQPALAPASQPAPEPASN
jgi:hypothetical protein